MLNWRTLISEKKYTFEVSSDNLDETFSEYYFDCKTYKLIRRRINSIFLGHNLMTSILIFNLSQVWVITVSNWLVEEITSLYCTESIQGLNENNTKYRTFCYLLLGQVLVALLGYLWFITVTHTV